MKKYLVLSLMVVLIMVLTACEPSAEQDAPTQPLAVTLTPGEPTIILYDLSAKVTDQDGNPITWATGFVRSSGNDLSKEAGDTGQLVWKDLPEAGGSLTVSAQGYVPIQQSLSLERGSNQISIVLERDPYQLDPMIACQPGQRIIYVEDFEDGQAQNMDNLTEPEWSFVELEDGGLALSFNSPGSGGDATVLSEFSNAVWQFDLMTSGVIDIGINWHVSETTEGANPGVSRYYIAYQPGVRFELNFERPGEDGMLAETNSLVIEEDTWYTFAIAYYRGAISVWVDGQMAMNVEHAVPIEKGQFGFQINPATQAEILFDNLIVCGLEEPYTPPAATP